MAAWVVSLSPVQRLAEENLINGIGADGVDALVLRGDAEFGKTTILERVQRAAGGVLLAGARRATYGSCDVTPSHQ